MELLAADDAVLAFVRRAPGVNAPALLCAFNLSRAEARYPLPPEWAGAVPLTDLPLPAGALQGQTLVLPPCGALFATF